MNGALSVFIELSPLSPATCFYGAVLLGVALFFKFNRLLSMRNLDVLTVFALMPGFLLLIDTHGRSWWGYLWLLGASGYFLARCLIDLILERRPALSPNLSIGGLMWLAGALFVGLVAANIREPEGLSNSGVAPPVDAVPREVEKRSGAPAHVVERGLTMLCHLSIVVGLILIGWRHFDDLSSGVAAATFYLLLPYAYFLMPWALLGSGRWDHPLAMALMVWSVFTYRRPMVAGAFLGAAIGCVFFPVWTLPVWLSFYSRRGVGRFAAAALLAAGLCLAVSGAIFWLNDQWPSKIQPLWKEPAWLPWFYDQTLPSFWQSMDWVYRVPVFIVFLAFVLATLFWPAPKNLAHVMALSAAHLIGIQFWYPDQGGVYVLWYLPFLLLLVFRPNLSASRPPLLRENDWLARWQQAAVRWLRKLLRLREPAHVG